MCVVGWGCDTHNCECVEVRGQAELVPSFHHVGPGDGTRVARLGSVCLYLLSRLAGTRSSTAYTPTVYTCYHMVCFRLCRFPQFSQPPYPAPTIVPILQSRELRPGEV